jgi:hypothetical protein
MATPPPAKPTPPLPRLRFTLAGLFLCLLGIAIGLAYWRLPQGTIVHGLFASFSAWLLMGQFQKLTSAYTLCIDREAPPADQGRALGSAIASLGIICLIAIAAWTDLNLRLRWNSWFSASSVFGTSLTWSAGQLREAIFYLAVILAYWRPNGANLVHSPRAIFLRSFSATVLLALGSAFGALVIWSILSTESLIIALVHYAIRGVLVTQPLRWAGRPFSSPLSPPDHLLADFLQGAIAAAVLVAMVILAAIIAFGKWRSSRAIAAIVLCLHAACLVAAGWLLPWSYNTVLPELSPFMRAAIFDQPLVFSLLAPIVVLVTAIVLAQPLATRFPGDNPFLPSSPSPSDVAIQFATCTNIGASSSCACWESPP